MRRRSVDLGVGLSLSRRGDGVDLSDSLGRRSVGLADGRSDVVGLGDGGGVGGAVSDVGGGVSETRGEGGLVSSGRVLGGGINLCLVLSRRRGIGDVGKRGIGCGTRGRGVDRRRRSIS